MGLVAVSGLMLAGAVGPASAASTDKDTDIPFIFVIPTVSVEYGQGWNVSGASTESAILDSFTASVAGAPTGYQPSVYGRQTYPNYTIDVSAGWDQPPLVAGQYAISVAAEGGFLGGDGLEHFHGVTPNPATLTVTAAKLGTDFRVISDTSNRDAALISARLTGTFIDQYYWYAGTSGSAVSPGGSWDYVLTDSNGEVALEKTIEVTAGSDIFASSFLWFDAEPGETYTATAAFAPDASSSSNFAVTPPQEFSYTAPTLQRPEPVSAVTPVKPAPVASTDFSLPLWVLILGGVLALALAVTVVLLSLRFVRARQPRVLPAESSKDGA